VIAYLGGVQGLFASWRSVLQSSAVTEPKAMAGVAREMFMTSDADIVNFYNFP
jgi:hypothetical protein